jgi:hypothetical protein
MIDFRARREPLRTRYALDLISRRQRPDVETSGMVYSSRSVALPEALPICSYEVTAVRLGPPHSVQGRPVCRGRRVVV